MKILILVSIILSVQAQAKNLDNDVKVAITKAAAKHNVPEWELLKIAFVESSLRKSVKLRHNTNNTYDVGMFQINSIHWNTTCKSYDVSKLDGNAMCAAKLLSQHKSKSKTDENWVARYHSKTPKHKNVYASKLDKAEIYLMTNQIGTKWVLND